MSSDTDRMIESAVVEVTMKDRGAWREMAVYGGNDRMIESAIAKVAMEDRGGGRELVSSEGGRDQLIGLG